MKGRVLVVAFEGWTDAGEAASRAAVELRDRLHLRLARSVDPEPYYDYQYTRPRVKTLPDGNRALVWPGVQLYVPTDSGRVLVMMGQEPARSWQAFVAELVDVTLAYDVDQMIVLGSLLADAPHTRDTPVILNSENDEIRDRFGVERSQYEGPVGVSSVLAEAAEVAGVPTINLWAQVPHYVQSAPNPKAALALVARVASMAELRIDTDELERDATNWQRGVDGITEDDEDMAEYIQQLEAARDTVESPEASGDAIAEEFERYLRRDERRDDRGKSDGQPGPA